MLAYVIQVVGFCEFEIVSIEEILIIDETGEKEVSEVCSCMTSSEL